jgi:MFS-type transporter involved in bile tolerance (Atg22 family)
VEIKDMDKFTVYYFGVCLLIVGIIVGATIGLAIDGFLVERYIIVFSIVAPSIIFVIAIFRKWSAKFNEQDRKNETK